jgi:hypothetical protein
MRLEPREASSLLLGRGSFLPSATCRAIVDEVMARAWWQRSEIGEAGASSVDMDTCNSLWCWLEGRYRQLVMTRLAVLAKAMGSLPGRPRLEEPIVLRYDRLRSPRRAVGRHGTSARLNPWSFAALAFIIR